MATTQRPSPRSAVDRPHTPLGHPLRPLLTMAAAAVSETAQHHNQTLPPAIRRRDSTEDPYVTVEPFNTCMLSHFILNREKPITSSQMWHHVLTNLRARDLPTARRYLGKLSRHRSTSPHSTFDRCRAVSVLAILSLVDEWNSSGNLSFTASKRLAEGIALRSKDCIALATFLFINNRWSPPSSLSAEQLGEYLDQAAHTGHATAQAVLASILCRSFDSSEPNTPNLTKTLRGPGETFVTEAIDSGARRITFPTHRTATRARALKLDTDVSRGTELLLQAASQGQFSAIASLKNAVSKGHNYHKLFGRHWRGKPLQKSWLVPWNLSLRPTTSEKYFSCVQNAANMQTPDCVFLVSRLLRKGIGCQQSSSDALRWIAMAVELNVPDSFGPFRARIARETWRLMDILARECNEDPSSSKSDTILREKARIEVHKNKKVIRLCDEKVSHRKHNLSRIQKINMLYRLCNLQTKIPDNLSEALVRLIFERDRDGWRLGESEPLPRHFIT